MTDTNSFTSQLNRSLKAPINRLGFALLCAGIIAVIVSLAFATRWGGYNGPHFPDLGTLLFDRARHWWQSVFRYGLTGAVIGAWVAWLYQPTLGKLLQWIKIG